MAQDDYITKSQFEKFLLEEQKHHIRDENELMRLRDTVDRWRVQMQSTIEKHHKTLYGNGEPGMDEILRNTNKSINDLHAWMLEQKAVVKEDKKDVQELRLLGFKVSAERKSNIITGVIMGAFSILGIIISKLL